ncbi:MAG TPA: patatin-like phospholipase family protein [Candidatus Saccharimonadales bacterium]|jgi:NTE family protein|nr:patatin-like phospholipase family protein [Candidatus Saccharimonadales bacterium]
MLSKKKTPAIIFETSSNNPEARRGTRVLPRCAPLLIGLIFVLCVAAFAQNEGRPVPSSRKKIALVLEGGGALGLAHIGVIEWMEENRIPVDYIAGTSMGGLVGGMYAMGYTPTEIHDTVAGVDWDAILYDRLRYRDLDFRRREDLRSHPNTLEFGVLSGLHLPAGFNSGHQVGLLLDRLALPYSTVRNFDDLPIPFRCVGVDLVTRKEQTFGQQRIYRDGLLSVALRATMSVPGIFSPVRNEERVYVDGGVLNNLPVDVAQQMGAELVIAVHLQSQTLGPQEDLSVIDVLKRSAEVVISANEARSLERLQKADIAVVADVTKFAVADYDKYKELIAQGRKAAESKAGVLKLLSLSPEEWKVYTQQREARKPPPPAVPQFVAASAGDPELEAQIQHDLSKFVGRPLKTAELQTGLDRLVGAGRFGRLGYGLTEENGVIGLAIDAAAKDNHLAIIKPVIEIDGGDYRTPIFTLGTRVTAFDIGGLGAEWRSDLLFGSQYGFVSEYYRPVRAYSRFFVSLQGRAESSPFNIYVRNDHQAQYQLVNFTGAVDLGFNAGRNVQIRAGYEGGQADLTRVIGAPLLTGDATRIGTTSFRIAFDRLDAPVVPRNGVTMNSTWQWHDGWLGSTSHFPTGESQAALFKSISHSGSLYLEALGGSTLGFANNGFPSFSLGGPWRLSAYGAHELLANQYFYGRAGYLHQVFAVPSLFGGTLYLTGAYEVGKTYGAAGAPTLPMDGAAGMIFDTAFGPIFLGASAGESGHKKFFFYLGKLF